MFEKHKNAKPETPITAEPPASTPFEPTTPVKPRKNQAVIGETVHVKGEISSEEDLIVNGHVEGNVACNSHELTIGHSGRLIANIAAKMIRIEGTVEGDITGHEKVIITQTGKVRGNIVAPAVTLEDGAKFKGSIDMDPSPEQPVAVPLKQKPALAEPTTGNAAGDKRS